MLYHVRLVRKPRGRAGYSGSHFALVGGAQGINRTLCGAEMTDHDCKPHEVRGCLKPENMLANWDLCPECLNLTATAKR